MRLPNSTSRKSRSTARSEPGLLVFRNEKWPSGKLSLLVGGEAVAEELVVVGALLEVGPLGLEQAVAQRVDPTGEVGAVIRRGPEVGDDVLELAVVVDVAEDHGSCRSRQ